ncbi:MAG: ribose-phosphate pyrophosphokinase [Clostridia bacterium]|nr:ribose-phosphate pyrophosphokinase [Clostridia bacterium]MBR2449277.1 ribose-phosphate pyrophosphokinase [Clostridia bacterium]
MITHGNTIELIAGNSNRPLAEAVAAELKLPLSNAEVGKFSDGEINITLPQTVRGRDVFIIQSTSIPVNDNLMELLIMIDACKRASAGRITAVMPYFGYARQDRKARPRDPITAKLVADILTSAGADRVLTMDLHAAQIQGFFDIPVDHLYGAPILARYFKNKMNEDWVVVSPDVGSVGRARNFASRVNASLAIVDKRRPKANAIEVMNVIGDVKNKSCIMVDDMIDTAGTICQGAEALVKNGAKEVYACCTHGVLSGPAMERLIASPIKQIVVLDTIDLPENVRNNPKIKVLSVAKLVAKAITTIYSDTSLSAIYED